MALLQQQLLQCLTRAGRLVYFVNCSADFVVPSSQLLPSCLRNLPETFLRVVFVYEAMTRAEVARRLRL